MSAYIQTTVGSDSPPIGAVMDYAGTVEPSGWLFCWGQSLPATGIYADLYAVIGTTYGGGGGNFNLPDFRGRVGAGRDNMGGTAANRMTSAWSMDGTVLGANGGTESHLLTIPQIPNHTHTTTAVGGTGTIGATGPTYQNIAVNTGGTGGSLAHPNVQPTLVVNRIIKYTIAAVVLPIIPGTGDVTGPNGGVTDGQVALFNGTSGKIIRAESNYRPAGLVYSNPNTVLSPATNSDMHVYTMPAGMMSRDGDCLRITTQIGTAANANAKVWNIIFGSETVYTLNATWNNLFFYITVCVMRSGATAQIALRTHSVSSGGVAVQGRTSLAQTLANQILVKINGGGPAANDVFCQGTIIEFLPSL